MCFLSTQNWSNSYVAKDDFINDPLPPQHRGSEESLDWGLDTMDSPVVGGALGMDFVPTQDPSGTVDPVPTESAVPNNGIKFHQLSGAQRTIGSTLPCPGYHD